MDESVTYSGWDVKYRFRPLLQGGEGLNGYWGKITEGILTRCIEPTSLKGLVEYGRAPKQPIHQIAEENQNMGKWEWILVPTMMGAFTGLVLSNYSCQRLGRRLWGFVSPKLQGALGGLILGALIGVVIGVLSGPGGGKRWLTGLGTGGTVGLLSGLMENEEGWESKWYWSLLVGAAVGCGLRLLVYAGEHYLFPEVA